MAFCSFGSGRDDSKRMSFSRINHCEVGVSWVIMSTISERVSIIYWALETQSAKLERSLCRLSLGPPRSYMDGTIFIIFPCQGRALPDPERNGDKYPKWRECLFLHLLSDLTSPYPSAMKTFFSFPLLLSSDPINRSLSLVLTTPPMPYAGTILPILATQLGTQSLRTLDHLCEGGSPPTGWRLYRSSPSKCSGVLMIWTEAGIESWARIALDEGVEARASGMWGASNGGRLK